MSKGCTARTFYELTRLELISHIKMSNQGLFLYLASTAAVFTVAFTGSPQHLELLLIIPLLCVSFALIVSQHDILSGGLAAYCNREIRSSLKSIDEYIPHWDESNFLKYYQPQLIRNRLISHTLVLLPPSTFSLVLTFPKFSEWQFAYKLAWVFGLLATLYCAWVVFSNYLSRRNAYERSVKDQ